MKQLLWTISFLCVTFMSYGAVENTNYTLGKKYAKGEGGTQDFTKAVHYYQLAANQEVAEAQYLLGIMYAYGEGIIKNKPLAVRYLRKAADQGYAPAKEMLESL